MTTGTKLTRRAAIASVSVGAAAVALPTAGAAKPSEPRTLRAPSREEIKKSILSFQAGHQRETHGDQTHKDPPAQALRDVPFNPQYMAIAHLTSEGAWQIASNHAHFSCRLTRKSERINRAGDIIRNKLINRYERFKDEKSNSDFIPISKIFDGQTVVFDFLEFVPFNFGSQHDIYFFFEHSPGVILFDPLNENLITVSKYRSNGQNGDENKSFYNSEAIPVQSNNGDFLGTMIRIENRFMVEKGLFIKKYKSISQNDGIINYKLNLIYTVNRPGGLITMVIDPDTGNGSGLEPFRDL